jgi:hypothetical protein
MLTELILRGLKEISSFFFYLFAPLQVFIDFPPQEFTNSIRYMDFQLKFSGFFDHRRQRNKETKEPKIDSLKREAAGGLYELFPL